MPYGPDRSTLIITKLPKELWGIEGIQHTAMMEDNLAVVQNALYGHPESGKLFNDLLDSVMLTERLEQDPACYMAKFQKTKRTHYMYLPCHVDDILLAATHKKIIDEMNVHLEGSFVIKNEKQSGNYLSLEVRQLDDGSMTIGQTEYVEKLIEKYDLLPQNSCNTSYSL